MVSMRITDLNRPCNNTRNGQNKVTIMDTYTKTKTEDRWVGGGGLVQERAVPLQQRTNTISIERVEPRHTISSLNVAYLHQTVKIS